MQAADSEATVQIFIREKKVKVKRMTSLLRDKIQETYRPQSNPEFRCDIEMGFNTENENLYGMMLYHRNRLIRPYHRWGVTDSAVPLQLH